MQPPSLLQTHVAWKRSLHQVMLETIAAFFQLIEEDKLGLCYELKQQSETRWLIRVPMLPPAAMAAQSLIPDEEKYIVDGRVETATDGLGWLIAFPVAVGFWTYFVEFAEADMIKKGYGDCLFEFSVMTGKTERSDGYTCLSMKYFGRRKC